jgi:hypothetical protein
VPFLTIINLRYKPAYGQHTGADWRPCSVEITRTFW